jgi:serine/threonine-protein kinase
MGAVFLARDLALDRPVAIKVLPPDLAARPELRERFLRETRTAAAFSHPNIVPVHAVEARGGVLCFVMGYVEGETLAERLKRAGPLGASEAVRLLQETAWALSYAHGRGVVHRDVKPDNILLERATGRALVTDFGIARATAASGLTAVGEVVGTPHFMSPEQAAGETVDGRSDLYSLGVVAFCAVTGRVPFDGTSSQAVLAKHLTERAAAVGALRPDLPASLAGAIDRLLLKEPAERFATGEALVEALDAARLARPELAPALRVFHVKAGGLLRNALILLLIGWALSSRVKSDADRIVDMAVFLAVSAGLVLQVGVEMRELARSDFGFADLQQAMRVIREEQRETAAQRRAAPDWARRRRRRAFVLALAALSGAGLLALAILALRQPVPGQPGYHRIGWIGILVAIAGAVLMMLAFVTAVAGSRAPQRFEARIVALLSGGLARRAFAFASRGLRATRAAPLPTPAANRGPVTAVESLPKPVRRRLGAAVRRLEALEAEAEALAARERELDATLGEAKRGAGADAARDALMQELTEARDAAHERRTAIGVTLERARLQLLRLRSGLGRPEDVEAELGA